MNLLKSAATALIFALTTLTCAAPAAAQTVEYVHTDALGSVVAVTDANRNIVERREYEPYGYQLNPTLQNGPGYTGHVQDAATGLTYMQQRYYDPLLGRFLSVDPVQPGGSAGGNFNRYWYGDSNPYKYLDPDGRAVCANTDCSKSRIENFPTRQGQPPTVNGNEGLDLDNPAVAEVARGNESGPMITFVNDAAGAPAPPPILTTPTAVMVEQAVIDSGAESVNINSTTGGGHSPNSRHYQAKAVDINRVNGSPVVSAPGTAAAARLQESFSRQPNIRENFGPSRNEKKNHAGGAAVPVPAVAASHQDHIHVSGQQ